jgi:hypothetical protein
VIGEPGDRIDRVRVVPLGEMKIKAIEKGFSGRWLTPRGRFESKAIDLVRGWQLAAQPCRVPANMGLFDKLAWLRQIGTLHLAEPEPAQTEGLQNQLRQATVCRCEVRH